MKELEKYLDEVANEYGYESWVDLKRCHCMNFRQEEPYLLKAINKSMSYAFEKGCKTQRKEMVTEYLIGEHGKCTDAEVDIWCGGFKLADNPFKQ